MLFTHKPKYCFTIQLANINIEVHSLYWHTKYFCKHYLTKQQTSISITLSFQDIQEERNRNALQAKKEGKRRNLYSNRYYETLALARKVTKVLLDYNILLFHGAVMAYHPQAYLFTAKSGVGKTTHCKLWLKNIEDCHILNGDKPLLLFQDNQIYACGSPWQGKENYGKNEILPLTSISILQRDTYNHIEEISLQDHFEKILKQCHIPEGADSFLKVVSLLTKLSNTKLYQLSCNKDKEAAIIAFKALTNQSSN